jgi:NAD(P)-dependent dehydrogenase (short-subunit alcohol dehydrogenase family)
MKCAAITGASGYLGSLIASELAQRGWDIITISRDDDPFQRIIHPIHACIHAAAPPLDRKPLLSLTLEEMNRHLAVALGGAFMLAAAGVPYMPPGGVFVGITTDAIETGKAVAKMGSYIPAKYALRGFLRVLATELKPQGIRVNAVAPGFMAGGLNRDLPEAIRDLKAKTTREEVAATVVKLCTDITAYPSGTSIRSRDDVTPI